MVQPYLPLTLTSQFRAFADRSEGTRRNLGPHPPTNPAAAAKAAQGLEGVFLNLLWQQMWRTVGQGDGAFLPGGLAGDIYKDFLTQAFSEKMAEAGGIGLAGLVEAHVGR